MRNSVNRRLWILSGAAVLLFGGTALADARGPIWLQADQAEVDAGIEISVNGDNAGKMPVKLELPPGRYEVVAKAADGRQWRQTIDVTGGETRTLQIQLSASGQPPSTYRPPPPPAPPAYPPPPPPYPYGYYRPPPRYVVPRLQLPPEPLPFVSVQGGFGFGGDLGGLVGVTVEGGVKYVTGFLGLGYTPVVDIYGNYGNELGYSLGVRAMGGSRFFKGWFSLSWGPVFTDDAILDYGVTGMVGGRWFITPYLYLHGGVGIAFPMLVSSTAVVGPWFTFSLALGWEFFGR